MPPQKIVFVTGRLAEASLRRVIDQCAAGLGAGVEVEVLPISVAALMHVDWVARKLPKLEGATRVILPGWCQGDLRTLESQWGAPVERGPKDLLDLPEHLLKKRREPPDLSDYDIEILAEINHAPQLGEAVLLEQALALQRDGADLIDVGCIPGMPWARIGDVVAQLRKAALRVSVDSFERTEVEAAVAAGAELVLSCNSSNRDWLVNLGVEVVAIPDDPHTLQGLSETIAFLEARHTKYRIDPVLEPIGFGFAASLGRYLEVRRQYPEAPMMMGIGNLTELSEVDSAGLNLLLAGFCQEGEIFSVLTTQVINWCRTAVREFDLARRLVAYAARNRTLPKHLDSSLVMLRDPRVRELGPEALRDLSTQIKDPNYRIFVDGGELHIMSRDGYWRGTDPYALFDQLPPVDGPHAFYLGYELSKAVTALTLGKTYRQDEALRWGFLTREEISAVHRRKVESSSPTPDEKSSAG